MMETLEAHADEIDQEIMEHPHVLGVLGPENSNHLISRFFGDTSFNPDCPDKVLLLSEVREHPAQDVVPLPELYFMYARMHDDIGIHPLSSSPCHPDFHSQRCWTAFSSASFSSCVP